MPCGKGIDKTLAIRCISIRIAISPLNFLRIRRPTFPWQALLHNGSGPKTLMVIFRKLRLRRKTANADQGVGHELKAHGSFGRRTENIQEHPANCELTGFLDLSNLPISLLQKAADQGIDVVFLLFFQIKQSLLQLRGITGFLDKASERNKTEPKALPCGKKSREYTHTLMAKITLIGMTLQAPQRKCLKTWDIVLELAVDPQDFLPLMQTLGIGNDKNKARIVARL